MVSGGVPPNGILPDLGSRNVVMDTENASEAHLYVANLEKANDDLHLIKNPENLLQDSRSIFENRSVLCQGFSIREYVGKVRSVNIRKCWPLSESLLEERLKEGREPPLPPLKSPNFRWWACQNRVDNDGEHTHIRSPILYATENNNPKVADDNIEKQLTVSLGSSQVDPSISQDLEEQIKKLSSVQISGEDEDVVKIHEEKRRMHSAEDNLQTYLQPLEKQTLKCTVLKALDNRSPTGKFDIAMHKARRVKTVGQSHSSAPLVSVELKGSKTVHLSTETAKVESAKYSISDMSKAEGSGLKLCPVCKTFSSTTVTAVNAHMDDCLAQAWKPEKRQCKTQKKKSRSSKKRSIIDIFAAAPQVQIALNSVQNNERDESGGSEGMDICSDDATANLTQKENSVPIETASEPAFCDDLPSLDCKRKKSTESRSPVQSEEADNGRVESLQMKRKRQRCGIISTVSTPSATKQPQTPSAFTDAMDKDHSVANHLKRSRIVKEVPDEQQSSMQMTCRQSAVPENNQHGLSGTFEDQSHFPRILSTEHKTKAGSILNNTPLARENGRFIRENSIEEPSSIVTMANVTSVVSHLYGMHDSPIPENQSCQSQNKFNILDNNEYIHDKEDNPNSCTLEVEGRPKPLMFSAENSACQEGASLNPDNIDDNERSKGTYLKSKCNVMHLVDEKQPLMHADNSEQEMELLQSKAEGNKDTQIYGSHHLGNVSNSERAQGFDCNNEKWNDLCSQKGAQCFETRKGTKGQYIRHTGLNLNQKACVFPRDSKGRFVSSVRKNEKKEGNTLYPPWKQSHRHKSTKTPKAWSNTTSVHNETNFSIDAAFSNARFGKATPLQTCIPVYKDHHSREEPAVTQEVASSYDCVETLSNGRRSLLPTAAVKHVEAHSSGNKVNLVKFCTLRKCSNHGYMGLPLDSQGELIRYIPTTRPVVTQIFRSPDNMNVNNPWVTESTKMPQEFSFLESIKTSHGVTSVNGPLQTISERKQTNHWQEYLISNQPKQDRMCSEQSFLLDQTQRDKTYCGSSHIEIGGSSKWTSDTRSNARPSIQTSFESGYNADERGKALGSEKRYPEVQNTRREQTTTQPVIRLMGKSFTISGEREAGNALNDAQQGNRNDSQTTTGVSSAYMDYCRTCNKKQSDLPEYGVNDLWQHPGGKANATTDHSTKFKEISSTEKSHHSQSIVMKDVTTFNRDERMMVENRLTDCTHHGQSLNDQSISAQIGMSTQPLRGQKFIPPVFYWYPNEGLNEGPNLGSKDSHVNDQGWLTHNQSYSELLNSYLEKESFQKTDWLCPTTLDLSPVQPQLRQSLQSPSCLRPLSNVFHSTSCAPTHSASMPAKRPFNCHTTSSTNAPERANMAPKLPKNKSRNKFKSSHEKGKIIDIFNLERKCRDDLKTRESIQEIQGLHRKWIFEQHEDCPAGHNQKYDAFSIPYEQHNGKNAFLQMSSSSLAGKHGNSMEILEDNIMDWSNAGSSLQFAEPRKLSGGAKHILKPSLQTGNGKQSLSRHYTLPFAQERSK